MLQPTLCPFLCYRLSNPLSHYSFKLLVPRAYLSFFHSPDLGTHISSQCGMLLAWPQLFTLQAHVLIKIWYWHSTFYTHCVTRTCSWHVVLPIPSNSQNFPINTSFSIYGTWLYFCKNQLAKLKLYQGGFWKSQVSWNIPWIYK